MRGETFLERPASLEQYTLYTVNGQGQAAEETVSIDGSQPLGSKQNPIAVSTPEDLILFGQLAAGQTVSKYYILDSPEYDMQGASRTMEPLFPGADAFAGGLVGSLRNGAALVNCRATGLTLEGNAGRGMYSAAGQPSRI